MKTDQQLMDDFFATRRYDKTPGDWRKVPETDSDNIVEKILLKEWLAPTSATSGIVGYGSKKGTKSRRRVRLTAKENAS